MPTQRSLAIRLATKLLLRGQATAWLWQWQVSASSQTVTALHHRSTLFCLQSLEPPSHLQLQSTWNRPTPQYVSRLTCECETLWAVYAEMLMALPNVVFASLFTLTKWQDSGLPFLTRDSSGMMRNQSWRWIQHRPPQPVCWLRPSSQVTTQQLLTRKTSLQLLNNRSHFRSLQWP